VRKAIQVRKEILERKAQQDPAQQVHKDLLALKAQQEHKDLLDQV
jgi:hypothetical protein